LPFGGEPPPRVRRAAALGIEPLGLARNPPLRLSQLLSLELQLADGAFARVGRRRLQIAFDLAELLRSVFRARRRRFGVLAAQVRGGPAHLLRRVLQLRTVRTSTVSTCSTVSTLLEPFGFPLQLHLLARERLEPPFPLLFRESGVGEVALFAGERFLAFRQ